MRRLIPFVAIALTTCGAVHAAEPGYAFIEGGAVDIDARTSELESDGWFVGFSAGFKHFHIPGQFLQTSGSAGVGDTKKWNIGVGWHGLLGEKADVVVEASYLDVRVDTLSERANDDGLLASGGVRWRIVKVFEINGFVDYVNLSDRGSDTGWRANILFNIGPVGIGLGYQSMEADIASAYLRWNFGGCGR
jgi:hypothetical protein